MTSALTPRLALLLTLPPLLWAGNAVVGRAMVGSVPPLALNAMRWWLALALLLMLPLAATSFNRAIRALGAARWQALHRAVYAIAVLAILHFFWMRAGKHDFAEVAVYAAIVAALLGWRALRLRRLRQPAPARAAAR